MELNMRFYLPRRRAIPAYAACTLALIGWMELARAATVAPPRRPVASQTIVAKPGEPAEMRARLTKKQSNAIRNKVNGNRDESANDAPTPDDN
ncbi:hypothetical protein [Janthinobacterium fluminis]|uniref:Uncharacterized protein n=1 Tax=Janthinobacterium fluminis TaxID=2987524 RepID=A0ABT5K056_9BURK|nr:hypothetical protein [Janthinobacterium fluminis]MDC8758284.1 hypothetical protein [Janthinobacterium fluminis]